jgi:hypothetical protein
MGSMRRLATIGEAGNDGFGGFESGERGSFNTTLTKGVPGQCERRDVACEHEGFGVHRAWATVAPSVDLVVPDASAEPWGGGVEQEASGRHAVLIPLFEAECRRGLQRDCRFTRDSLLLVVGDRGDGSRVEVDSTGRRDAGRAFENGHHSKTPFVLDGVEALAEGGYEGGSAWIQQGERLRHGRREDHGLGDDRSPVEGDGDPMIVFRVQRRERGLELDRDTEGEVLRHPGHRGYATPVGWAGSAVGFRIPLGNGAIQSFAQGNGSVVGISGGERLSAVVEGGTVDPSTGQPSTHAPSLVEHEGGTTGTEEFPGSDQSCHASADHEDIRRLFQGIHSGADASSQASRRQLKWTRNRSGSRGKLAVALWWRSALPLGE